MGNSGIHKRIQKRVLEMLDNLPFAKKKIGSFHVTEAVEAMALFCKQNKKEFKEWHKNYQK